MSFFQNVFAEEFRGNMPLGDRQYVLTFICPQNQNTCANMVSYNAEPYDFSGSGSFTINYAYASQPKNFSALTVDVAGATPGATTAAEVAAALNADATFADMFTASTGNAGAVAPFKVWIAAKQGRFKGDGVRCYISNSGAETKLRFNFYAGVAELPTYYARHTIENRFNWPDSVGMLVELDESDPDDQELIEHAGLDPADMQADWELLRGRSGIFNFQKVTVDGDDRITEIIEYPAGAQAGDLAKKTTYTYTGANLNPSEIFEVPYTLEAADLITP